jgi:DNA-binding transcriptional ArsR family regulator
MVKYNDDTLDAVFSALADPTRRAILARLCARDGAPVGEIAALFPISGPAVTKHLDVLEQAGLIERAKQGRNVSCRTRPDAVKEALQWLERYQAFWSERLDALVRHLETKEREKSWTTRKKPALPSSGASKRR